MSGLAAAEGRLAPPSVLDAAQAVVSPRDSAVVRLAVFAAFGLFGASHWSGLIAEPHGLRAAGEVAIAVTGGAALALLPRFGLSRAATATIALVVAVLTVAAGFAAAGLELRLMLPGGWDELRDGLDRGLAGVHTVNWPYGGQDEWVRLTILLGAPLMLGVAAALAFWPAGPAAPGLRANALIVLLGLYGIAATEHDPGRPLLRGFVLLLLVAAWLWLPRLSAREAATGAVLVMAVGVCALPVAGSLDADRPWWDYRSWDWFGGGKAVTFDWNHSYGPLDWPREGTTLLNVRSDRPHYWKAETLDRFDGVRWMRSPDAQRTRPTGEIPRFPDPRWIERLRFTVRALSTDFVVGAGTPLIISGAGATSSSADGTTERLTEPLERGDSYTVRTYAPNPTARQMRAADPGRADLYLAVAGRYTSIVLPPPGRTARERERAIAAGQAGGVTAPLRGGLLDGSPGFERAVLASPYAEVYRLAQRVAGSAPTPYDAVKRVERHLQRYRYSERVPTHRYPLAGFLFEDRRGYCQQFSGAAALMLRMVGVPTRVVSGFSPGSLNSDTGEYRVRDLDAHSWIEVYFSGIGWVPFDPTPTASPAESQSGLGTSAASGNAGDARRGTGDAARGDRSTDPSATAGSSGGGGLGLWTVAAGLAAVGLLAGTALLVRRGLRRRALTPAAAAEAQLRELERALPRLGWSLPGGTTLLALERRLGRAAGPAAAHYVARLRGHRFAPGRSTAPGAGERRELRRELTASGGLRARLRGFLALPPRGSRRR
jgi:transglutaminase-like putative cysteine protease